MPIYRETINITYMKRRITLNKKPLTMVVLSYVLLCMQYDANAALTGTYTINPGGSATATNYLSLTSAISDMVSGTLGDGGTPNGSGVTGPVILELGASYTDAGETFPLTLGTVT